MRSAHVVLSASLLLAIAVSGCTARTVVPTTQVATTPDCPEDISKCGIVGNSSTHSNVGPVTADVSFNVNGTSASSNASLSVEPGTSVTVVITLKRNVDIAPLATPLAGSTAVNGSSQVFTPGGLQDRTFSIPGGETSYIETYHLTVLKNAPMGVSPLGFRVVSESATLKGAFPVSVEKPAQFGFMQTLGAPFALAAAIAAGAVVLAGRRVSK